MGTSPWRSLAEARTAALNLFVVVEAFYLFSCRSLSRSVWHIGLFTNRWIIGGVLAQALGQIAITYLPAMNAVFGTAPITAEAWLRIVAVAAAVSLAVAIDKGIRNRQSSSRLNRSVGCAECGGCRCRPRVGWSENPHGRRARRERRRLVRV